MNAYICPHCGKLQEAEAYRKAEPNAWAFYFQGHPLICEGIQAIIKSIKNDLESK